MKRSALKVVAILSFTTLLTSCSVGNDPEDPEVCTHPIKNSEEASYVAAHIASAIGSAVSQLPDGAYNNEEVSCFYSTMTITGIISRTENESCGTNCSSSYNNHEIIANLSDCSYIYRSFLQSTVTGVINYSDTTGEQQIDQSSSTFGSITITDNGSDVSFRPTWIYTGGGCTYSVKEVLDTISSISSSGESSYQWDQSGSIAATGGTFFFDPESEI